MTTLKPPVEGDPERILITGGPKVGKTTAYLSIAAKVDGRMHVLSSDRAMTRMLSTRNLPNLTSEKVSAWEDYVEGAKTFIKSATPNDWLVVDLASPAWDAIQSWYTEKRFGKTADEYFTAHAMAAKKGNPLDGDKDWSVINRNYRAFMNILLDAPCHLILTTTAKAISERDDPQIRSTYGPTGIRPAGQKEIFHDVHTLVVLTKNRTGDHLVTTVGDRERKLLEKAPWTDFSVTYLMAVAGWRPA